MNPPQMHEIFLKDAETLRTENTAEPGERASPPRRGPALIVLWWRSAPDRVGEVLLPPRRAGTLVFGRDGGAGAARARLVRQRPGQNLETAPVDSLRLSREQLALTWERDRLTVLGLGQRTLLVDGRPVAEHEVEPGTILELDRELLLLATRRPDTLPAADLPQHAFGQPDADGLVGESPAAWELRRLVQFVAPRREHVLVSGPSGAGKELVAAALHRRSGRQRGPWVSRNAATIPETLVDAELFGNARNYPNPGMAEREGLVGAAHGGTLFLDEFAELGAEVQAHLLRVLDDGEYHRLGETHRRRSDFRLIAATNRPDTALKHDVLARLGLRLRVPGLELRPEDIPLLALHLLRGIAATERDLAARYVQDGQPRLSTGLVRQLVAHRYTTHARELRALLWRALAESPGDTLDPLADLTPPAPEAPTTGTVDLSAWAGTPPPELPAAVIQAALDQHGGVQELAWRALGLDSRYQLKRLIQRHRLIVRKGG